MTENEAIKYLEFLKTKIHPNGCNYNCLDAAIKAIKEARQYWDIGTVEELRAAREKQRAKKPYIETEKATGLHGDYECYECPNCDSYLATKYDADNDENYRVDYCRNCGQAIDWS